MWQNQQQQQRPILRRHNTDPMDNELSTNYGMGGGSSGSLSSLTAQLTQGVSFNNSINNSLQFSFGSNDNLRQGSANSLRLSQGSAGDCSINHSSGSMLRSQSMQLPGVYQRSASGRYHNETFRFPSVPEDGVRESFSSNSGSNSGNGSLGGVSGLFNSSFSYSGSCGSFGRQGSDGQAGGQRSHSNVVLGGMFANHLQNGMFHSLQLRSNSSSNNPANPANPLFSKERESTPTPGPSELYRLISSPCPDYPAILARCKSHPVEACSFSLHAGCGHVYALHRLLRREEVPYEVVEGVMRACPRAVVRKQAVREEEDFMEEDSRRDREARPEDNEENNQPEEDVRYEYPLGIAAEYSHSSQILRLLARSTFESPHYRAEVYRSLDYASLQNETVRILLEEYAECVLERGDSEENEGDDDDCPLEKVLFWWDDPDVTGMEEDIANYPNCEMKEDLDSLWEKLVMMLYAATSKTMSSYDTSKQNFKVLHYLLRIVAQGGMYNVSFPNDFTHAVLLLAKFIQRERVGMFRERDEGGSLPLHIAVSGVGLLRSDDGSRGENLEEELQEDEGQQDVPEEQQEDNADVEMDDAADHDQNDPENQPAGQQAQPMPQPEDQPPDPDDDVDDIDEADMEEHDNEASSSASCGMEIIKLILEQHPASIRLYDTQTRSLPIHLLLKHNPQATEAIDHFLRLYPKSASMPDGEGRLPIHIALLNNSPSWEQILELAPNTLEKKDPTTGLLPFQLAGLSVCDKGHLTNATPPSLETDPSYIELESLSTSFNLLRRNPHLASGLAEATPDAQVVKLQSENKALRQRVAELEAQVMQMQMLMSAADGGALKKRKSFNAMEYLSRMGDPSP